MNLKTFRAGMELIAWLLALLTVITWTQHRDAEDIAAAKAAAHQTRS